MSSSIRPPGPKGGGFTPGAGPIGPSDGAHGARGAEQVERSKGPTAGEAVQSGAAAQAGQVASSPSANWIRRLEAGEVTRAEAIEGLVAHAVEQHGGAKLSPALRSELEGVLRTALLEDPVLGRMLGDS